MEKDAGLVTWKESQKPVYRWYNGTVKRYTQGEPVKNERPVELNRPVGQMDDPFSRIYPFKSVKGVQPVDPRFGYLIVPDLWKGFWKDYDWDKASQEGMKSAGLPYSGEVDFVETLYYRGLNHEVLQKENALSCVQCHTVLENEESCGRCHESRNDLDFQGLAKKGLSFIEMLGQGHDVGALIGSRDYIDFRSLGYKGDPIEVGGRFKKLPIKTRTIPGNEPDASGKNGAIQDTSENKQDAIDER
jgi:hypothetical protein